MSSNLYCPDCGQTHPVADGAWRCRNCGSPLEISDPSETPPTDCDVPAGQRGLWAFAESIPVERAVSLGEGFTPEVTDDRLGASFKLEYLFPSSSYKDRGVVTMISQALEAGVERVINDSSGNAGFSIALYGSLAGIDVEIYAPASAPESKLRSMRQVGATVHPIEGTRREVKEACLDAIDDSDAWYASHWWRPSFIAGTKTIAFEICYDRGWEAPDVVALPVGAGTLFLGASRGFEQLADDGIIDEPPRLVAAQATGFAPFAERHYGDPTDVNDIAKGIHIDDPARNVEIERAIDATDGTAIAVSGTKTGTKLNELRRSGYYVEPTSAVAPAAVEALTDEGWIRPDDDVVVGLTGSGFKDPG